MLGTDGNVTLTSVDYANSAGSATNDGSGRNIVDTYMLAAPARIRCGGNGVNNNMDFMRDGFSGGYFLNYDRLSGGAWHEIVTTAYGLATVATSGNYNDLSNKPSIPSITWSQKSSIDAGNRTWTINGCTVGKPLIVIMKQTREDFDYAYLRPKSGVYNCDASTRYSAYLVGTHSTFSSTNCFIVIPSSSTVVIDVNSTGGVLYAYN